MKKVKNIIIIILIVTNIITGVLAFKYKNEVPNIPDDFKNSDKSGQNDRRMGPPDRNQENNQNETQDNTDSTSSDVTE